MSTDSSFDRNICLKADTYKLTKEIKAIRLNQAPKLIWFTGLSGSGKSTLANLLEIRLHEMGYVTAVLDGDIVRKGLNKDLGFSVEDRIENMRRIGAVSKLMMDSGMIVLSAFISPYREDRSLVAQLVGEDNFLEIFVDCPLEVCEQRDVKGLYKKARAGMIRNFTGIDSAYEPPLTPRVQVFSNKEALVESLEKILKEVLPVLRLT